MSLSNNPSQPPVTAPPTTTANNHTQSKPPQQQQQQASTSAVIQKLTTVNEQAWLTLGNLAEMMADWERAMNSYESALRHNPYSIPALSHIASLCRGREMFAKAVEYFKRILAIQEKNGETWSALGHCYLMMDNLQEAYQAYQQALYHLQNPNDPKLWYGIGILYDRYGSIEHAEEAFSAVMRMDPQFEKANEVYFRLGIIYKQQQKYDLSLQCFRYILHNPPKPLTEVDIWFQTGHVYEQQKEYELAKEAYERVLNENPDHAKVLQQLGWLYHQQNTSFSNQPTAIQYLTRSLKADSTDAQSWYLLGRCYMVEQNYNKAYEAYQQAVYRDARNPTFWCSIGVLYYQINQYRDALDAYSRAIRLNPYISEVWYDLGTLYESCNNQVQDALDAYQRAAELDPSNPHIRQRLELLRKSNSTNGHGPTTNANSAAAVTTPVPQDVHNPYQYQNGSHAPHPSQQHQSSAGAAHPPPPPPLVSGGGPPHASAQGPYPPHHPSHHQPPPSLPPHSSQQAPVPRDLPLLPNTNRTKSPVSSPYQNNSNGNLQPYRHSSPRPNYGNNPVPIRDVRIPDIIGNGNNNNSSSSRAPTPSDRPILNPMRHFDNSNNTSSRSSPMFQHPSTLGAHNNGNGGKMPSIVRSPVPTKSSPRVQAPAPPPQAAAGPPSNAQPPYPYYQHHPSTQPPAQPQQRSPYHPPQPHHAPSHYTYENSNTSSPRTSASNATNNNEPLRRASILFDNNNPNTLDANAKPTSSPRVLSSAHRPPQAQQSPMKRESLPLSSSTYQRHGSTSSTPALSTPNNHPAKKGLTSPIESSAADTLMSMSQQKSTSTTHSAPMLTTAATPSLSSTSSSSKRLLLEMADDDDDEDHSPRQHSEIVKKQRISTDTSSNNNNGGNSNSKSNSIAVLTS